MSSISCPNNPYLSPLPLPVAALDSFDTQFNRVSPVWHMGGPHSSDHAVILHTFTRHEWVSEIVQQNNMSVKVDLFLRGVDGPLRKDTSDTHLARRIRGLNVDKYTDFAIHSMDGKVFHVHRVILGSVSDVFEAMLDSGGSMREGSTGVLNMDDFTGTAIEVNALLTANPRPIHHNTSSISRFSSSLRTATGSRTSEGRNSKSSACPTSTMSSNWASSPSAG